MMPIMQVQANNKMAELTILLLLVGALHQPHYAVKKQWWANQIWQEVGQKKIKIVKTTIWNMDLLPLSLTMNLALNVYCALRYICANDSMKPSQLGRPLGIQNMKTSLYHFLRCLKSCNTSSSTLQNFTKLNDKYLEASFKVCYPIAKKQKATYHWWNNLLFLPQ